MWLRVRNLYGGNNFTIKNFSLMKNKFSSLLFWAAVLAIPHTGTSQTAPPLGAAASFALFTAVGAVNNAGPTVINGNIGTNAGAFNGFPPGIINGNRHVANTLSTQTAGDVQTAFAHMSGITYVNSKAVYGSTAGVPQTLLPGSYTVNQATTLAGQLILDAQNDPNALFFLRVTGALTTGANSLVTLANGASARNVYWLVTGRVDLGQTSMFKGTLIVDGSINMIRGASLEGRGLTRQGAITLDNNTATLPMAAPAAATATEWRGNRTTDWFASSNWTNGVPTSLLDALVPLGTAPYPVITNGTASAKSLDMAPGTALTMGGGTLDLEGDLVNDGTIAATGGTVLLSGAGLLPQNIGGSGNTQLWNLTLNHSVAQAGDVSFRGVLNPANNNLATNGNDLTLLSDATGTGLVDNSGTGSITGNATVQRHISTVPYGGPGYRHYSSPVTGARVSDLATPGFTPSLNQQYNTSAAPGSVPSFPNVFRYDEARVLTSPATTYSAFDKGWVVPTSTEVMLPGLGYSVNIPGSEKVDFVGALTNGPVSRPLTRANSPDAGYHLLGNPYPSPIDWSLVNIPAGMNSAVYVFESSSQYGGSYRSFLPGMNGNPGIGNPLIPVAQSFFVRATAPATLTLTNAVRQTTLAPQTAFHRTTADSRPLVQLTLRGSSAPALTDEAYVYFQAGATTGIDGQFDALKIKHNDGGAPTLWAAAAGSELAINGLPALAGTTTVPLGIEVPQAGTFVLEAAQLLNLTAATVTLHDAATGQTIDLRQQPAYSFRVATAGVQAARFTLTITPARPTATVAGLTAASISLYPNPATGSFTLLVPAVPGATQVTATLLNGLGQAVRTQSAALPAAGVQLPFDAAHLASGFYLVRVQAGSAVVTKRVAIQ